jgi:deoxyribose-phosphate aldolase
MAEIHDFEQLLNLVADRVVRCLAKEGPLAPIAPRDSAGPSASERAPGPDPKNPDTPATNPSRLSPAGPELTGTDIARRIDHTLLKAEATREEIVKLCDEARQHGFATVCVNAANVALAARLLQGSSSLAIAVVGFPLGATLPSAKAFEAREAVRCGAREVDMVINLGALKSRDYKLVFEDIRAVVESCPAIPVKVILETSRLDAEQKVIGCALAKAAGAAFVKTSTGFAGGGATTEDVALMRRVVGDDMGVKASGGVRSLEDAKRLIAAGADRIGASASVAIVTGQDPKEVC